MAVEVQIHAKNIKSNVDIGPIADELKRLIASLVGDDVAMKVYDRDGQGLTSPILLQQNLRKIK